MRDSALGTRALGKPPSGSALVDSWSCPTPRPHLGLAAPVPPLPLCTPPLLLRRLLGMHSPPIRQTSRFLPRRWTRARAQVRVRSGPPFCACPRRASKGCRGVVGSSRLCPAVAPATPASAMSCSPVGALALCIGACLCICVQLHYSGYIVHAHTCTQIHTRTFALLLHSTP